MRTTSFRTLEVQNLQKEFLVEAHISELRLLTAAPSSQKAPRSPLLHTRPNINLPRKTRLRLRVQMPIRIRNRLGINHRLLGQTIRLRPRNVNHPVNDRMRDVHALGTELPSEGLRLGAEGEFHGGEGGEEGGAFDGGGCAGEDESGWVGECGDAGEEEWEGCLGEEEGSFAVGRENCQPSIPSVVM